MGGEGHAWVDGLGGGTEPKSETELPSLGFGEPNVGRVVFK